MNKIVLHATDLDGYLKDSDKDKIAHVDELYKQSLHHCSVLETASDVGRLEESRKGLVASAKEIGRYLKDVCAEEPSIHVYSFETP
jgi:uracil phosphoribosyltransferase